jgi:hypothetical protein
MAVRGSLKAGAVAMALLGCTTRNPAFSGSPNDLDLASMALFDLSIAPDLGVTTCRPDQLQTDPHHCGGCDNDCTTLPNVDPARVSCVAGMCSLAGACVAGFADCTSAPGCETSIASPDHCGSCASVCSGATPLCAPTFSGYKCTGSCPPSAPSLCDNMCVDELNDPAHCGSCAPCPKPVNGGAVCVNGVCGTGCAAGFHDCNGQCVFNSSVATCGSRCMACMPPANATATCDGSRCGYGCNAGFMDTGSGCVSISDVDMTVLQCVPPGGACAVNGACCSGRCLTFTTHTCL